MQPGLRAALRALAVDEESTGASALVHTRLLEEVRRLRLARRRAFLKLSALAAALVLVTGTSIWRLATEPSSSAQPDVAPPAGRESATAFFPLFYSTVPISAGRLVRLEVPREAAASFGIEIPEPTGASASSLVLADVLVGEDGVARAVRFVRPLTSIVQTERQR